MKLYVYRLEDVKNDNFDGVKAIDVIEGETNQECESKAENQYCSNDYGYTYCEMDVERINISAAAAALGRKGGQAKTEAKARASRENGKKGGRRTTISEEQTYIAKFKKSNPIVEFPGDINGAWKWKTTSDCIDLRYGHKSKLSAQIARSKAAKEYALFTKSMNELIECPTCHQLGKKGIIIEIGQCAKCLNNNAQ